MVSGTFYGNQWNVLPTAIGRNPPSRFFSAINIAQERYVRSSKGTFPSRITFTTMFEVMRKFNPVCLFELAAKSFKIWSKMSPKNTLEPLEKDMRALRTKNYEVEKQPITVGSETELISLYGCFSLWAA